ncbi:glutamate synthase-related protein [Desulfobacula sp.]|uniref:glutamate synthase-related protein n=1 Tax=Desulfobacula sp. TaxID=2593537 RepID=UPI00260D15E1|nr:glutamate synthase-related protein [Desulfobacula sp.]
MPQKYNIKTKAALPRFYPVGKYATIEFRENCAGSCKECVKKKCVYDIFKDNYLHMSKMEEPEYLYTCNSCFRCIQECTKGIFSRVVNPEYREIGDEYWTPDVLSRTWYQAHTGSVPVSGAGYRGPFVGKGFDSMWTDMSEIVRPTRDGIHGREYINTCIELSRRPERLSFNKDGSLAIEVKPILEIPLPILFEQPDFGVLSKEVLISMLKAAQTIGTKMFISAADVYEDLMPFGPFIIPLVKKDTFQNYPTLLSRVDMVEIEYEPGIEKNFGALKAMNEELVISVGIGLRADLDYAGICVELSKADIDTIHVYANSHGREFESDNPRFIKDMLRDIHLALIDAGTRQQINIIASGGICMAEHVNKSIICGADGVAIDRPLLIAMECRLCDRCRNGLSCPVELESIDPAYGSNRITNLMSAWRNQMLEMLGAMGLREARRLRGEVGRSMWFEDLEKESFAPIFGERKVSIDVG